MGVLDLEEPMYKIQKCPSKLAKHLLNYWAGRVDVRLPSNNLVIGWRKPCSAQDGQAQSATISFNPECRIRSKFRALINHGAAATRRRHIRGQDLELGYW